MEKEIDPKVISAIRKISEFLQTTYHNKKHGGYAIYEDDKIKISVDTYYPNIDVWVKSIQVLNRSGHGYNIEYHSGKWEQYITDTLLPRALKAEQKAITEKNHKDEAKYQSMFHPANSELDKVFV